MKQTANGVYVLQDREADYKWLRETLSWHIPRLNPLHTLAKDLWPIKLETVESLSIGVDVETKTLRKNAKQPDPQRDELVGIGLALTDYCLARGDLMLPVYGLATDEYVKVLQEKLGSFSWYAHNAMFDATVLRRYGIRLGKHAGDPRIVAYLLGEIEAGLKPLLQKWLGYETLEYHEILERWGADDISQVPVEEQADYCALQDAAQCVILEQTMRASLTDRVLAVYEKVELPMVNILVGMTERGIRFNREAAIPMLEVEERGRNTIDEMIQKLVEASGFKQWEQKDGKDYYRRCEACKGGKKARLSCEYCWGCGKEFPRRVSFNPASTDQLRLWLYNYMGAPVRRYAGVGHRWQSEETSEQEFRGSTDSLALLQLKGFHEAIPLILSQRKFAKRAQFLTKWLEFSEPDGRLHPMWNNTRVATGRLSSSGPNMQQVTLDLRSLFVAD